ncbi:MAG TPA: hypothetical protein VFW64_21350 [Pseudonocardiaceae bacterium]|nr:hypothetical protein [Pseudonocardiaceae bacterium]
MNRDEDLATIQEYCQQAAIAAVADLIRAQDGQLAVTQGARPVVTVPPGGP